MKSFLGMEFGGNKDGANSKFDITQLNLVWTEIKPILDKIDQIMAVEDRQATARLRELMNEAGSFSARFNNGFTSWLKDDLLPALNHESSPSMQNAKLEELMETVRPGQKLAEVIIKLDILRDLLPRMADTKVGETEAQIGPTDEIVTGYYSVDSDELEELDQENTEPTEQPEPVFITPAEQLLQEVRDYLRVFGQKPAAFNSSLPEAEVEKTMANFSAAVQNFRQQIQPQWVIFESSSHAFLLTEDFLNLASMLVGLDKYYRFALNRMQKHHDEALMQLSAQFKTEPDQAIVPTAAASTKLMIRGKEITSEQDFWAVVNEECTAQIMRLQQDADLKIQQVINNAAEEKEKALAEARRQTQTSADNMNNNALCRKNSEVIRLTEELRAEQTKNSTIFYQLLQASLTITDVKEALDRQKTAYQAQIGQLTEQRRQAMADSLRLKDEYDNAQATIRQLKAELDSKSAALDYVNSLKTMNK